MSRVSESPMHPSSDENSSLTIGDDSAMSHDTVQIPNTKQKRTPVRPLYDNLESAFSNIAPSHSRPRASPVGDLVEVELDDFKKVDFSSTRPPRIDLGPDNVQQEHSVRKKTVGIITRAFSVRKSQKSEPVAQSECPLPQEEPMIQSNDPNRLLSNPFGLEDEYAGVFQSASQAPSQHTTMGEMINRFRQEGDFSDEESLAESAEDYVQEYAEDIDPFYYRHFLNEEQQNLRQAPDMSLPPIPQTRGGYELTQVPPSSEVTGSYGDTQNLLATGQQSFLRRTSDVRRMADFSVLDMRALQSPLERASMLGRQVFFDEDNDENISLGDVRLQPQISHERDVSTALHNQVASSGPSRSTGPSRLTGRIPSGQATSGDGGPQSSTDSNNYLSFLDAQERETAHQRRSPLAQNFYNEHQIDSTWVDSQDLNEVRIPIRQSYQPSSSAMEDYDEQQHQQEEQNIGEVYHENEWETVAETASVGHAHNHENSHNYFRQAGSSLANTSDPGDEYISEGIDFVSQQAAPFSSREPVVQHPGVHSYHHRFVARQVPGEHDRDFLVPQYTGYKLGTNNSLRSGSEGWRPPPNAFTDPREIEELPRGHTNPFSASPPEQLDVDPNANRGAIVDFGRDPYTNSSNSQGLNSTNYVGSSQILTGYDPGSSSRVWDEAVTKKEEQQVEEDQRGSMSLVLSHPVPARTPRRRLSEASESRSSLNSYQYVFNEANNTNITIGDIRRGAAIPMVDMSIPRAARLRGNVRGRAAAPQVSKKYCQQSRKPFVRGAPGSLYQGIRSSRRQQGSSTERLIRSGTDETISSKTRKFGPGSDLHPVTLKPWPRISTIPGPDGHHPHRNQRQVSSPNNNQSINMGEFRFQDSDWEFLYTPDQMARIHANHRRRVQQQQDDSLTFIESPSRLRPIPRRSQFITDPQILQRQNNISWLALVLCIVVPGPFWFLYWYGALDSLICNVTRGEIENFGYKQKKFALWLGCLSVFLLLTGIVCLIWYLNNRYK